MKLGIEPEWVEDLLGLWAATDATSMADKLGHGRASPMFVMWGVVDDGVDSDGSYSSMEVAAMRHAVDCLRDSHPEMYRAILATFKPWTGIAADAETLRLARCAATVLAAYVDRMVGDDA